MRVSIGQKLTLSFLLVALLVGVLGFVGYSNMKETEKDIDVITKRETPDIVRLAEMKSQVLEGVEEAFAYPLLDDPVEKAEFYEKLEQFDISAAAFKETNHIGQHEEEEENALFNRLVAAKEALAIAAGDMFESYERDGTVNPSYVTAFEDEIDIMISLIDRLLEIEGEEVAEAHQNMHAAIAGAKRLTIFVVSVAILLAIGLGVLVSRSISVPINKLRDAASRLGRGELDTVIDIKSKDEIGELASSFNQMASQLKTAYGGMEQKVRQRTEELEQTKNGLESEIVERKQTEEELQRTLARLSRSNQELEQFAHIASHDLQEPLRMVSSYTQLLERRYKDKLDSDANEFIGFAVDGAKRMQTQINDLLAYSRVTTQGNLFEATNCADIFESAVTNLTAVIEESGAMVTRDPLPTLPADSSQLGSVFQNLIGNGIKYQGDQPPRIHVSAVENGDEWIFSFKDNGIGIEAEFHDRIFVIFQRLHSKTKYGGTGIGLTICRKVIERHGGRIWVESEPQKGSNFYFTLPMRNQQGEGHEGPGLHEIQTN